MTTHRAINIALAALIAAMLSSSYLLDGPSDHSAEHAQAAALEDAIKAQAAAERYAKAKAALCGSENAVAVDISDVEMDCLTKRGHKTKRVSL